jgi:hypothetical protein
MMHPDEIRARESVVARLRYRFPDAPIPDVIQAVANCFEQYVNARVRDFIELLVEREVADQLRAVQARSFPVSAATAELNRCGDGDTVTSSTFTPQSASNSPPSPSDRPSRTDERCLTPAKNLLYDFRSIERA